MDSRLVRKALGATQRSDTARMVVFFHHAPMLENSLILSRQKRTMGKAPTVFGAVSAADLSAEF